MTAVILGAIATASFFVWIIPQDDRQTIIVSDFDGHLKGVQSIHQILSQEIDESFQMLQNGQITPEQYNEIAETTTDQINSQIVSLVQSQASEQWHPSYIEYIEALKTQNSIIRETTVVANMMQKQADRDIKESLDRIEELKSSMWALIAESSQNVP